MKQRQKLKYFPSPLFWPPAQLHSFIAKAITSSPLPGSQREMEGCGQSITAPHAFPCSSMVSSHELTVLQENLLHPGVIHGPLHVLQGNTCSTVVSPKTSRGYRGISARRLEHLLPSSFSHLEACSAVPHTFSPLPPHCLCGALQCCVLS